MEVIKDLLCSCLPEFVVTDIHSIFEFIEVSQLILFGDLMAAAAASAGYLGGTLLWLGLLILTIPYGFVYLWSTVTTNSTDPRPGIV